jgi:hypothetical protein
LSGEAPDYGQGKQQMSNSMSPPKGLATVALLKTRLDEGKDHLGLYEPFVYDALVHLQAQDFVAEDVKGAMQLRSGIVLPSDAIQTLLARCAKRGYLRRSGGRFFRTAEAVPDPGVDASRGAIEKEQQELGAGLVAFATAQGVTFSSEVVALEAIAAFISENKVHLLLDESVPKSLSERPAEERKRARTIARFIAEECPKDSALRESLRRLTEGIVLHDALLLVEIPKAAERFQDLQIFLDTPVLFSAVDLHGVASAIAAKETLTLLRESGARTLAFRRTIDEMRGILAVYEEHLSTAQGRLALRPTPLAHHVLTSKLSSADIRVISATLEARLTKLGIQIREYPPRDPRFTSDEKALGAVLADENRPNAVTGRVRHDVDSVAAILTLRRGYVSHSIERSVAIFCTSSGRVVRNVQRWFAQQRESGVPPVVHQLALTSIAWLKKPAAVPDLKMHELAVLCAAVLRPTQETWGKFIDALKRLRNEGAISDDETAAIVASELTEPLLARLDDDFEPDADSIAEAIERVREEYRREASVDAERVIRAAKADAKMAEGTAAAALARAEAIEARVQTRNARIGRVVARSCFVMFVLVTVAAAALSLPGLFDGISGKVMWAARFILLGAAVLGILSAVYGNSLTDMRAWIESRVSSWLNARWLPSADRHDAKSENDHVG